MKVIIDALKVYQDIYKRFNKDECEDINLFLQLLKPYQKLSIQEFSLKLTEKEHSVKEIKDKKNDIKMLGICYYELSKNNGILPDELGEFLQSNKEQPFIKLLKCDLRDSYLILDNIDLKDLRIEQLKFLGYALFGIEVRGRNKAEQKKYLLQLLWKAIENQKMNEIYESAL